ncbi:hypothetical protein [Pokkaliibacter plantistimulans]|nr:hypothetical protein [Pokkaliibacter plantistimulans]
METALIRGCDGFQPVVAIDTDRYPGRHQQGQLCGNAGLPDLI